MSNTDKCSNDKVYNPKTGRCVLKTGKIGAEIMKKKSPCTKGQVYNPKTGRCVLKTGKIGAEIMKSDKKPKERKQKSKGVKIPSKPPMSVKSIYEKCNWTEIWRKHKKIGSGSAGMVYSACYEDNCEYILKIQNYDEEFLREAKMLSKLNGWKHSPKIYGIWKCKNKGYIIEEKLKNINYKKEESYNKIKNILKQLHTKYYISYPDIHDENVMMREDGTVVLIDFGWAEQFRNSKSKINSDNWLTHKLGRPVTLKEMSIWEMQNLASEFGNKEQKKIANSDMMKLISNK